MPGSRPDFVNNNYLSESNSEKFNDDERAVFENGLDNSSDRNAGTSCRYNSPKTNKAQRDKNMQTKERYTVGDTRADTLEKRESNYYNGAMSERNAKEFRKEKTKTDGRNRKTEEKKTDTVDVSENIGSLVRIRDPLPIQQVHGRQDGSSPASLPASGSLANEIAKARQHIKQSLQCVDNIAAAAGVPAPSPAGYPEAVIIQRLQDVIQKLDARVSALETQCNTLASALAGAATSCPVKVAVCPAKPTEAPKVSSTKDEKHEDDDDVDLFDSDSEGEDAEAAKIREERLAAYNAKKAKKPALIAKSNIILDVKPWDDETDMKEMEKEVRKIETDGLLWGAAKLVPLAFGIHKLQISCVVEDDKVSIDWLTEKIQEIEDFVQSVDIAAFNKV